MVSTLRLCAPYSTRIARESKIESVRATGLTDCHVPELPGLVSSWASRKRSITAAGAVGQANPDRTTTRGVRIRFMTKLEHSEYSL